MKLKYMNKVYETTGEFRKPEVGEWFIDGVWRPNQLEKEARPNLIKAEGKNFGDRVIVKQIKERPVVFNTPELEEAAKFTKWWINGILQTLGNEPIKKLPRDSINTLEQRRSETCPLARTSNRIAGVSASGVSLTNGTVIEVPPFVTEVIIRYDKLYHDGLGGGPLFPSDVDDERF